MGDMIETFEVVPPAPFSMNFDKIEGAKDITSLSMEFDRRDVCGSDGQPDSFGMIFLRLMFSSNARASYGEKVAGAHNLEIKHKGFFKRKVVVTGTLHA
jgi:hypothetical protein